MDRHDDDNCRYWLFLGGQGAAADTTRQSLSLSLSLSPSSNLVFPGPGLPWPWRPLGSVLCLVLLAFVRSVEAADGGRHNTTRPLPMNPTPFFFPCVTR
ncbi:hypothetical protein LY76DRAFT_597840 [Colletotrichum caudatum]|nr:hypothetical protein LY76DRAFT_597840 [Colletotrichum caudatum]